MPKYTGKSMHLNILKPLKKRKKQDQMKKGRTSHVIIQQTLLIEFSFPRALNHVTYLKLFLMNKDVTDVVVHLSKKESKLEK